MDWAKEYHRERRMSWADIADAIHDAVTMDDVLDIYCPDVPRRGHRCPCPIHDGKDYNFSYTSQGYKCFVCGASGDTISFVKEVQKCSSRTDAMKRINADLHLGLPLDSAVSETQSAEIDRRRAERQKRQKAIDDWEKRYAEIQEELDRCDVIKMTAEPLSEEWSDACHRYDQAYWAWLRMPEKPRW